MKDIIATLHDIKHVVAAAGILIAFLIDKKLGPAEDDLPLRLKILLAAPVIVALVLARKIDANTNPNELTAVLALFMITILAYSGVWYFFGYTKEIQSTRPWWKKWGPHYVSTFPRVMGGILNPTARAAINSDPVNITPQIYFEGRAYDQDAVWTRGSRAALQVLLVLVYMLVVFFYTLAIAAAISS